MSGYSHMEQAASSHTPDQAHLLPSPSPWSVYTETPGRQHAPAAGAYQSLGLHGLQGLDVAQISQVRGALQMLLRSLDVRSRGNPRLPSPACAGLNQYWAISGCMTLPNRMPLVTRCMSLNRPISTLQGISQPDHQNQGHASLPMHVMQPSMPAMPQQLQQMGQQPPNFYQAPPLPQPQQPPVGQPSQAACYLECLVILVVMLDIL